MSSTFEVLINVLYLGFKQTSNAELCLFEVEACGVPSQQHVDLTKCFSFKYALTAWEETDQFKKRGVSCCVIWHTVMVHFFLNIDHRTCGEKLHL